MGFYSSSAEETKRLGAALAACLQPGDVVVLNGDLGAGKTQFVQGVAEALGVTGEVTSPTFNILLTYDCGGSGLEASVLRLNHFDLYRLESAEDLNDIGYWEVLEAGGVSFIEWGDKFPNEMPDDYLEVAITSGTDGVRSIKAQPHSIRALELCACWGQVAEERA